MGGFGSGRASGRTLADGALFIDIAWMIRTCRVMPGRMLSGALAWNRGGHRVGSIGYVADMRNDDSATLELRYALGTDKQDVVQHIALTHSRPNFGGRRWWMICPYGGGRCGKLFLPGGGDRFASRRRLGLAYASQSIGERDRPFDAMTKLQRRLGSDQGWGLLLRRPKGMWRQTFDRHEARYWELEAQCDAIMVHVMQRLT